MKRLIAMVCVGWLAGVCVAGAQTSWKAVEPLRVGGEGSWDYVTVDAASHRIFVTRGSHTQAIDEQSGKLLADIAGQGHSHGVAIAPDVNRGFITDAGGTGSVVVFDLKTYAVLGRLAALPDIDGIVYDAPLHTIVAVSGDRESLLTFAEDVSLQGAAPSTPIALGGKPEFLAVDETGVVYVNIEDKSQVAKVDVKARQVIARWPVLPGGLPVGLSIDMQHHRLFIGCRKPAMMVVMSTEDGHVESTAPIGTGVDATAYGDGEAFASCRDGSLHVFHVAADKLVSSQILHTNTGSGTMGLDSAVSRIFVPAALFEPLQPGAAKAKVKSGSFMLMQFDRSGAN